MFLLALNFSLSANVSYGDYPGNFAFSSAEWDFVIAFPFSPTNDMLNSYVTVFGNSSEAFLTWLTVESRDEGSASSAMPDNPVLLSDSLFVKYDVSSFDSYPVFYSNTLQNLAVADITGDGSYDLITSGFFPNGTDGMLLFYPDLGGFASSSYGPVEPVVAIDDSPVRDSSIAVEDIDGDGAYDVVVCGFYPREGYRLKVYMNNGPSHDCVHDFWADPMVAPSDYGFVGNLAFADVNYDGLPDLLAYGKFNDGFLGLKIFQNIFQVHEDVGFPFEEVARFDMGAKINQKFLFDFDTAQAMGGMATTRSSNGDIYVAVSSWSKDPVSSASYVAILKIACSDDSIDIATVLVNELMDGSGTLKVASAPALMKDGVYGGFDYVYISYVDVSTQNHTLEVFHVSDLSSKYSFPNVGGDFVNFPMLYTATERGAFEDYGDVKPSRIAILSFYRSGEALARVFHDSDQIFEVHSGSILKDLKINSSILGGTFFLRVGFLPSEDFRGDFYVKVKFFMNSYHAVSGLAGAYLPGVSYINVRSEGYSVDYDLNSFVLSSSNTESWLGAVVMIFAAPNVPVAMKTIQIPSVPIPSLEDKELNIISNVVLGWGSVQFSVPMSMLDEEAKPEFFIVDPRRTLFAKVSPDMVMVREAFSVSRIIFSVSVPSSIRSSGIYILEVKWSTGGFQVPFFFMASSM